MDVIFTINYTLISHEANLQRTVRHKKTINYFGYAAEGLGISVEPQASPPNPSPEERGEPSRERFACRNYDPMTITVQTPKIY